MKGYGQVLGFSELPEPSVSREELGVRLLIADLLLI
jgi:hypothetical protein